MQISKTAIVIIAYQIRQTILINQVCVSTTSGTIEYQSIVLCHRRVKRSIRSSINFAPLLISTLLISRNSSSIVFRSKIIKKEIKQYRSKIIDNRILSKYKLSEINHTKITLRDSLSSRNLYRRRSHCDRTTILKIHTIVLTHLWVKHQIAIFKERILITSKTKTIIYHETFIKRITMTSRYKQMIKLTINSIRIISSSSIMRIKREKKISSQRLKR